MSIIEKLKSFFKPAVAVMGTDKKIAHKIAKGLCPDCGSKEWYEGPSGGLSTNWYCANEECREGFNIAFLPAGGVFAERIGKREKGRAS